MNLEDRLREAIKAGEVLTIIYHGGSQPGASREIAPIRIENGKVSARCYPSHAIKSFTLDKIVIDDDGILLSTELFQPGLAKSDQYGSVSEFLERQKAFLLQLGWHIEYDDNVLSLHRKFKTGKPLKGSDVSLSYEEYACDVVLSTDGEFYEENIRKRQRPWILRGKNQDTKTYRHLDSAAKVFMDLANFLGPLRT